MHMKSRWALLLAAEMVLLAACHGRKVDPRKIGLAVDQTSTSTQGVSTPPASVDQVDPPPTSDPGLTTTTPPNAVDATDGSAPTSFSPSAAVAYLTGTTKEEVRAAFGPPDVAEEAPDVWIYMNTNTSLVVTDAEAGKRVNMELKFSHEAGPSDHVEEADPY
jgi:hypothetical protein